MFENVKHLNQTNAIMIPVRDIYLMYLEMKCIMFIKYIFIFNITNESFYTKTRVKEYLESQLLTRDIPDNVYIRKLTIFTRDVHEPLFVLDLRNFRFLRI